MNTGPAPGERRPGGALEAEVLALLQACRQAQTPGEVLQRLGDDLSYSTVVTVLSRLFDKGLLARSKQGRAYAYAPVADAHGLTARRMETIRPFLRSARQPSGTAPVSMARLTISNSCLA